MKKPLPGDILRKEKNAVESTAEELNRTKRKYAQRKNVAEVKELKVHTL